MSPSSLSPHRGVAPTRAPAPTGLIIGILVTSTFVMILNETVLGVALRQLSVDLRVPTTTVQWLSSGYLLTMAVVVPTTGFLLERFTPRRIYLTAMSLFAAGTLLATAAPTFAVLLAARIVQATGTAMMMPLLTTTVMRLVPLHRRGTTMGTVGIVIAVAPALGPTAGGLALSTLGWRAVFGLVAPLALAALLIGARFFHLDTVTRPVPLDVLSVALSAVGFGGLLYGLSELGARGAGGVVPAWAPMVVGLAALGAFVARQLHLQRTDRALLDLRPFEHRSFVVALALIGLLFLCLMGSGILLPLYVQTVLGKSALLSGLIALPGGLTMAALGRPIGILFDRVGARPLVLPGAAAVAVAMGLLATLEPSSPVLAVVGMHVVLMTGIALMMTPLMTETLSALPAALHPYGSALLSTIQQVAGAVGIALFVSIAAVGSPSGAAIPDASGLHLAFLVAAGVGALAFGIALLVRKRPAPPRRT